MSEPLLPPHGGYRKLLSFKMAQLAYDITVVFVDRYVSGYSRTRDQMVQAARSGVQNIAEGSQASGTSKKTELRLTNVARASMEELKLDYEDYLRQKGIATLSAENPIMLRFKKLQCNSVEAVREWINTERKVPESPPSDVLAANAALSVINLANFCLSRQISKLSETFEKEGGFTERLYRQRIQFRKNQANDQ